MFNRKEFLKTLGLTASALPIIGIGGILESCQPKKQVQSGEPIDSPFSVFDLHCHPGRFHVKGVGDYVGDSVFFNTLQQMSEAKLKGAFVSMVTDTLLLERTPTGIKPRGKFELGQSWADFQRQLAVLRDLLPKTSAHLVSSLDEMEEGMSSVFLACEGGDFLEGSIERVENAYQEGVRSIQLVHYAPNELGDLQTAESQHEGLSESGRNIVIKMNEMGMLIDVAHASFDTVKDVIKTTSKPIMLSHSILRLEAGRPIEARSITEDHAKAVADTGGVIGAWPSGYNKDFEEYVDNTMRLIDVVGIDHVGIGTDMDSNFQPVITNYSQVPNWISALQEKGLSSEDLYKLASGNILRVLGEVL